MSVTSCALKSICTSKNWRSLIKVFLFFSCFCFSLKVYCISKGRGRDRERKAETASQKQTGRPTEPAIGLLTILAGQGPRPSTSSRQRHRKTGRQRQRQTGRNRERQARPREPAIGLLTILAGKVQGPDDRDSKLVWDAYDWEASLALA